MAISGYFGANIGSKVTLIEHSKKKFRQLVLPAITFGILFCLSWVYVLGYSSPFMKFIKCYWFVKSAFICSLLYYFVPRVKNRMTGIIVSLIISQFIPYYQVSLMYPAFLSGVLLYRNSDILNRRSWMIFVYSAVIYGICFSLDNAKFTGTPPFGWHKLILDSHAVSTWQHLGIQIYKIIMGISGAIATISLFISLGRIFPHSKFGDMIAGWGALTLGIYLIQAILLEHFMMKYIDFSEMNFYTFNFIICPILSIIVLVICVGIIKLMRKSRYLRLYLLGEKK